MSVERHGWGGYIQSYSDFASELTVESSEGHGGPVAVLLARSPRFRDHDPGAWHPESPGRLQAIDATLDEAERAGLEFEAVPLRPVTDDEILLVHSEAHLARFVGAAGRSYDFDPDTHASPESVDVARLAAGTTLDLVRMVATRAQPGMALVRPPGHHALSGQAMGFCLLGNIALAAKSILEAGHAERIAIYDWDVHHGNGTQAMFYNDPRVLFMSTHQSPFYPGTGRASEVGVGRGEGTTVNIPLPAGTSDEEVLAVTDELLSKRVRDFSPDIILISAGYDGHEADPVGGFRMSTEGYQRLANRWRALAQEVSGDRIMAVLEGGYDLEALAASVRATLEAWA